MERGEPTGRGSCLGNENRASAVRLCGWEPSTARGHLPGGTADEGETGPGRGGGRGAPRLREMKGRSKGSRPLARF
jgi:hypothetical protein